VQVSEACKYIQQDENRKRVLLSFTQPLTAKQLAHRTGIPFDACRDLVRKLRSAGLIACLNTGARRSRLYWLTELSRAAILSLDTQAGRPPRSFELPNIDWSLYGWICYSHRAAILKTLAMPLQPAAIKRRARSQIPDLRMSANNVRDVIRLFVAKGIVEAVRQRKRVFPAYQPTATGQALRELLLRAEVPG